MTPLLSEAVSCSVVSVTVSSVVSATVSLVLLSELADAADVVALVSRVIPHMLHKAAVPKNIIAIKEACGSLDQITKIASLCDIKIISGDDMTTLPIMSVGGVGVISVLANIVPDKVQDMIDAWDRGQINLAQQLNNELYPLAKALFCQSNPIPVKAALAMMGKIKNELRAPLFPMDEKYKPQLKKLMKKNGIHIR